MEVGLVPRPRQQSRREAVLPLELQNGEEENWMDSKYTLK